MGERLAASPGIASGGGNGGPRSTRSGQERGLADVRGFYADADRLAAVRLLAAFLACLERAVRLTIFGAVFRLAVFSAFLAPAERLAAGRRVAVFSPLAMSLRAFFLTAGEATPAGATITAITLA